MVKKSILNSPDEREPVLKRVIEKIRPEVTDLFAIEMKKLLKERYNLSPRETKYLLKKGNFPGLP